MGAKFIKHESKPLQVIKGILNFGKNSGKKAGKEAADKLLNMHKKEVIDFIGELKWKT